MRKNQYKMRKDRWKYMAEKTIKMQIKDNIIMAMLRYVEQDIIHILEEVITEEFVKVNMEEITTLPVEARSSIDEQNKYIVNLFLYKKRNLKEKTKENYLNAVKRLIVLVNKPLTGIDGNDISYYLKYYENRNMVTSGKKNQGVTINNERRFLSAFFTWMRKEKLVTENPVETTEPRKVPLKPIDYFKKEEIAKLRDACKDARDRALIEVLRSTGARVGEIIPITLDMVDWRTGDIMICGEKGDKYRPIYLDEDARYYLNKYLETRNDNSPYLFVHARGIKDVLRSCGIRAVMKKIAKRAGVKCRVYPHKMRKTLGMNLKNSGVDIGTIQEILGHANPAVTATYYAQSTPGTLRSVRERVAA